MHLDSGQEPWVSEDGSRYLEEKEIEALLKAWPWKAIQSKKRQDPNFEIDYSDRRGFGSFIKVHLKVFKGKKQYIYI